MSEAFDLTTYYAKRIIGDSAAASETSALLQTGSGVTGDTWILHRDNRDTASKLYGIKYAYDGTNGHDKIEYYGKGTSDNATAWIQLDTGDASFGNILGKINITGTSLPSSGNKSYYLTYVDSSSTGHQDVKTSGRLYIYEDTTTSYFNVGSGSTSGGLTIHNANSYYANIVSSAFGANRTLTLPDQTGTIALLTKTDINALINLLDTGTSVLTGDDYIITQYVGGGTTTTTYHRRMAKNVRVGGLTTARSLWGNSFDGTANIGGTLTPDGNRTRNIGSATAMWNDAHIRGAAIRHIDAAATDYTTDSALYIGYGSVAPTKATYIYYSADTSSRTKFFEVNSNGAYAPTRFGVNGQSTSYNLYVNGTGYFTNNITFSDASIGIKRVGRSVNWVDGRDSALIATTSINGYGALASIKTTNGSWDIGAYNNNSYTDDLLFSYCTDTDHASATYNNRTTAQIKFLENGHIVAALDGNATTSSGVLDIGNTSKITTFAYSKAGLGYGDFTWLAGWNGYELRAVSKENFIRYINSTDATTWTADALANTDSIAFIRNSVTGAHTTGHIVFLNAKTIGTPFQVAIHDSSELYIWKRYWVSGNSAYSAWTKMNAGYADSAGTASSAAQITIAGGTGSTYYKLIGVPSYASGNQSVYVSSPAEVNNSTLRCSHIAATAGYLTSTLNSNTVQIGSQNASFCHITNSAAIPFWFNQDITMAQGKTIGQAGSQYRPYQIYLGRNTTIGSNAINSTNPLIEFSNSDRSQYAQLVYTDYDAVVAPDSLTLVGNQAGTHFIAPKINTSDYINNSYAMSTSSFICNSWIRTVGSTGWYNESYGGGWYMTDAKWVRTYNSKPVILDIGSNNAYGIGGHRLALAMVGSSHVSWIMKGGSVIYGFCVNGNGNWYFGKRTNDQSLESSTGDAYGYWGDNVSFLPSGDNTKNLGNSSNRWATIYGVKVYNAVWNDYAECRHSNELEPGRCVRETSTSLGMVRTTQRLMPGCKFVSDTYGTLMGETSDAKTPIAVSGRVLAYPYRAREEYSLGAAVCSAPNGTIDIMTREEIMIYPERIVGTVSEIPDYEIWHGGSQDGKDDIRVNGRIWIYVR